LTPQTQKEKREQLFFAIEELKREHALLSEVVSKSNAKIISMTEDVSARSVRACVLAG
jgi:hypothetical protein